MNKLYLECFSGISGDMFVASLLDLGADKEVLLEVLGSIPVKGFRINISRVKKAGLDVCDFDVILDPSCENHDHDMQYLFEEPHQEHNHKSEHHHQGHCHENGEHHHKEHQQSHEHRGFQDILEIIGQTAMSERAKETAVKIFTILGKAEAKAHGTTLEQVHFHEVGAVDSIVDIIAAAVCLDNLKVEEVVIPVLYEGCGSIRCQHGVLPVPVPAVANIIQANKLRLHLTDTRGELVTPTGAAIAAAIRTADRLPEQFTIQKVGIGAGKRNYEKPSLLRAMLIQNEEKNKKDSVYKLESNIDDCTGENLGYVLNCLMEAGALDVNYMPVFMKKSRPAYQLNVIGKECDIPKLEQIIFKETTTIGIRRIRMERSILEREVRQMETSLGPVAVKVCGLEGEIRIYPEYESVTALCKRSGKSFLEVFRLVERECNEAIR